MSRLTVADCALLGMFKCSSGYHSTHIRRIVSHFHARYALAGTKAERGHLTVYGAGAAAERVHALHFVALCRPDMVDIFFADNAEFNSDAGLERAPADAKNGDARLLVIARYRHVETDAQDLNVITRDGATKGVDRLDISSADLALIIDGDFYSLGLAWVGPVT